MTRASARHRAAAALGAALLLLATTAPAQETPPAEGANRNACVFFRTLYDWKPINNSNLIVWAPNRRSPYHLQLTRPCHGLRTAQTLGFSSRDGQLCPYGGDSILLDNGSGRPDRCTIDSITRLDEGALQALLDQANRRPSARE